MPIAQRFPKYGLQGGTRIDLLVSVYLHKNIFIVMFFTYRVLLINSWIFLYLFFKNGHYNFSQSLSTHHICVNSGFPNYIKLDNWMIFGIQSFPGARWYVVTVRVPQMVRDEKKFGNHCYSAILNNSFYAHSTTVDHFVIVCFYVEKHYISRY